MASVVRSRRRVLLVEPAAVETNVFSAYIGMPLMGPLLLGTLLRQAGFEVRVVSESLLGRPLGMGDLDADFLLLSCLTSTVERGYELAALFKRRNEAGKVAIGGPHVSFMAEEALSYADWVVSGEAEAMIVDLLRHGSSERQLAGKPVEDLDSLPFIDWSLLELSKPLTWAPVMLSRGCPYDCNFCSVTAMFGRRYRIMSVERSLAEMLRAEPPSIFIYDDNFAANPKHTDAFLEALLRSGHKVRWTAQVRADITRIPALLEKMRRSGCHRVYVGMESVDDKSLAEMHKNQTAAGLERAMRAFHQAQILVHGMFIFGADADTADSIRAAESFIAEQRVDSVQLMISTPMPGTELYKRMTDQGRLLHRVWRYFDGMHVVFRPRNFSPHELQRRTMDAYARYYALPHAARDFAELAAAQVLKPIGKVPRSWGVPSIDTAELKLMGNKLVRQWERLNRGYYDFLRAAEPARAPQEELSQVPEISPG